MAKQPNPVAVRVEALTLARLDDYCVRNPGRTRNRIINEAISHYLDTQGAPMPEPTSGHKFFTGIDRHTDQHVTHAIGHALKEHGVEMSEDVLVRGIAISHFPDQFLRAIGYDVDHDTCARLYYFQIFHIVGACNLGVVSVQDTAAKLVSDYPSRKGEV